MQNRSTLFFSQMQRFCGSPVLVGLDRQTKKSPPVRPPVRPSVRPHPPNTPPPPPLPATPKPPYPHPQMRNKARCREALRLGWSPLADMEPGGGGMGHIIELGRHLRAPPAKPHQDPQWGLIGPRALRAARAFGGWGAGGGG
jgi:hypothetical protein